MAEPKPTCDLCEQPAVRGFNNIREIAPTPDPKEPGVWWRNWEVTNDKMQLRCREHYEHGHKQDEMMSRDEIMRFINSAMGIPQSVFDARVEVENDRNQPT